MSKARHNANAVSRAREAVDTVVRVVTAVGADARGAAAAAADDARARVDAAAVSPEPVPFFPIFLRQKVRINPARSWWEWGGQKYGKKELIERGLEPRTLALLITFCDVLDSDLR